MISILLGLLITIIIGIAAIIVFILAQHKEEIWDTIEFNDNTNIECK